MSSRIGYNFMLNIVNPISLLWITLNLVRETLCPCISDPYDTMAGKG